MHNENAEIYYFKILYYVTLHTLYINRYKYVYSNFKQNNIVRKRNGNVCFKIITQKQFLLKYEDILLGTTHMYYLSLKISTHTESDK